MTAQANPKPRNTSGAIPFAGLCMATMMAAPAAAQSGPLAVLEPLNKCMTIPDPIKRLTCYDAAMVEARKSAERMTGLAPGASLAASGSTPSNFGLPQRSEDGPAAADTAAPAATFGLSAVAVNNQRRAAGLEKIQPKSLTARVVSHSIDVYGRLRVELENGQVWESTGSNEFRRLPEGEWTAEIKKSTFGGYRMRIDGAIGTAVVKRQK